MREREERTFIVWFRQNGEMSYAKVRARSSFEAKRTIQRELPSAQVGAAHRAAEDDLVTN